MKLLCATLVWLGLMAFALADDNLTGPSHYASAFFGKSVIILGSEDGRIGGGLSYGYGRPEKRFQAGSVPAQLVYEGYVDFTHSNGENGSGPNSTIALGSLAYARWRWSLNQHGAGMYADLGWGLQLADGPTLDLNSELNSTPVLDIGFSRRDRKVEYLVGLRFLHVSNAGTAPPNYGQNELFLNFGVRY